MQIIFTQLYGIKTLYVIRLIFKDEDINVSGKLQVYLLDQWSSKYKSNKMFCPTSIYT